MSYPFIVTFNIMECPWDKVVSVFGHLVISSPTSVGCFFFFPSPCQDTEKAQKTGEVHHFVYCGINLCILWYLASSTHLQAGNWNDVHDEIIFCFSAKTVEGSPHVNCERALSRDQITPQEKRIPDTRLLETWDAGGAAGWHQSGELMKI